MSVKQVQLEIRKTARYYLLGELSDKTEEVWIVLHGYGQLAGDFINNFSPLLNQKRAIVAPEALNKFYLKGFDGKVGAAWMTKEDRLSEITDYSEYLDKVLSSIIGLAGQQIRITVLGFSQGTATACRWVLRKKIKAERLILWGGGIPPDIEVELLNSHTIQDEISLVIGSRDQFISGDILNRELNKLTNNKVKFNYIPFNGGHEINTETLLQFIKK